MIPADFITLNYVTKRVYYIQQKYGNGKKTVISIKHNSFFFFQICNLVCTANESTYYSITSMGNMKVKEMLNKISHVIDVFERVRCNIGSVCWSG